MTIEFKNGKYYCRFQINGKRQHLLCKGAKTHKQAEKIETELKYIAYNQEDEDLVLMSTLYETFEKYSEEKRITKKQDKTRLEVIKEYIPITMLATDVKSNHILKLIEGLRKRNLSPKTINLYLAILRETFNMAIDDDLISSNPVKKKFNLKVEPSESNTLKSGDEENRLMMAATPIFKEIIHFTLNTGVRRENVIGLRWSNINFEKRIITLIKNKSNKLIKIPMTESLYNMLKDKAVGTNADDYVFINPKTKRGYKTTAFNEQWRFIREKAGLPNLRFHDLRHTVASRLANDKVPIPIIKDFLSHSDISTTMKYVHTNNLDMAVSSLNENNSKYENMEWTQNGHENK